MTALLLALLVFTGCGDDEGDDTDRPRPGQHGDDTGGGDGGGDGGGSGGGGDDTGDPPAFAPAEGHWVYTGGALVSDTCQYDADDLPAGEGDGFDLTRRGEGVFTMLIDGTTEGIDCQLTDRDYVCEPSDAAEPIPDWDITILSRLSIAGNFSDQANTTERMTIDVDCVGSDCGLAETFYDLDFPCQVVLDAVAQVQ